MANKQPIEVISITAKCSDLFSATAKDATGKEVGQWDGYVPDIMPDDHDGDYILLDIDVNTGRILNWKKPSQLVLRQTFKLTKH